jgi:hypothetical protein
MHKYGQYNFNAHPIAPPGTHLLVHKKPDLRASWAPHALDAWYLGPAMQHYRCHRAWIWDTRHERVTDTVTWLPKTAPIPEPTIHDLILGNTDTLVRLLTTEPTPFDPTATRNLLELATALRHPLLQTNTSEATTPPPAQPLRVAQPAPQPSPPTITTNSYYTWANTGTSNAPTRLDYLRTNTDQLLSV